MAGNMRLERGSLGERLAIEHLAGAGYRILARNYRTRSGELDVIAADENSIVFCEVKTRVGRGRSGPALPLDAIGPRKRMKLRQMAREWLASDQDRPDRDGLRFDAIGVELTPGGRLMSLEHVQNAF
jgi:putative endonuclease